MRCCLTSFKWLVSRVTVATLLSMIAGQAFASDATASAEFTYGVVGEYRNNAHQPENIRLLSSLNIVKVVLTPVTDDGRFGGTQGNDINVNITNHYSNNTTESFPAAINWRETNGSALNAIGFILDGNTVVNDGYVLTGTNYDKTYLLRISSSSKVYNSDGDISGNAANNASALAAAFAALNQEADSQGTGGGSADVNTSTIEASPTSVAADGSSTSTVVVTLKNASGNPIVAIGQTITLSTTLGTLSSVTDNLDGTYTATIFSSIAGTAAITGKLNNVDIVDMATVTFTSIVSTKSISGKVSNSITSSPVSSATVNLYANSDSAFNSVLQSQVTNSNGEYIFSNLANGSYSVEFVNTASSKIKAVSDLGINGHTINSTSKKANVVESIVINSSDIDNVNAISISPFGVVYDSITRKPIINAVVKLYYDNNGIKTIVPDAWLDQDVGAPNGQITTVNGQYSFVFNGDAITATYILEVTPPSAYVFKSTNIVETTGVFSPTLGGRLETIQAQNSAPSFSDNTSYYLSFSFTRGAELSLSSNGIANNHLPLDALLQPLLTYSTKIFSENINNDGSIANVITIDLINVDGVDQKFTSAVILGTNATISAIPAGLTAVIQNQTDLRLQLSLTGNAGANLNTDDVNNITLQFADGAFSNLLSADVDNATTSDIAIDYIGTAFSNTVPTASPQSVSTAEDTAKAITLVGADTDADTLTYSIVSSPTNGTLSGSGATITYTPNDNYSGTDSFTFKVNDGTVDSAVATVSITVTPVNDAPLAKPLSVVTDEEQAINIVLVGEDTDGDTLTFEIVTLPENGSLLGMGENWEYTPTNEFDGQDTFTYKVNDGTEDSTVVAVLIFVNDVIIENLPPVAVDDEISISSSEAVSIDVLSNDSDPEGGILTIVSARPRFGSVTIVDGQINFEPPQGFKGTATIVYSISDDREQVASASVKVAINIDLDDGLPAITIPDDICGPLSVNASGLYTKVDYGNAAAIDQFGNPVPVSVVDNKSFFPPGENIVYWQATDSRGNTAIAAQKVCVNPLVSLGKDQTVLEGEFVKVGIYLNGTSPTYPLVVAYQVSGTADSSDHLLISGEIEILSGTEASIDLELLEDSLVEANETVIIALSDAINRGAKASNTTTITEQNIDPKATLIVTQNGQKRLTITPDGGFVTINANVYDPNITDNLTFNWSNLDTSIVNTSGASNQFIFDPSDLDAGVYRVVLVVQDDGIPMGDDQDFVFIEVVETLAVLTDADSDGDNIPDRIEGYADSDGDSIPDYLDRINECNVLLEEQSIQDRYLIEADPGVCLRRGSFALDALTDGAHITQTDVANGVGGIIEDTFAVNVGGIFDFLGYGLPDEAQSVAIVLPQRNPVPANAIYRKYTSENGWVMFVENEANQLHSAQGEPGYCPPPRSVSWTLGLIEGAWCVQVQIEDGGANDDDDSVNGVVLDPGFVGVLRTANEPPVASNTSRNVAFNEQVVIDLSDYIEDQDGDVLTVVSVTPEVGSAELSNNIMTFTPPPNFAGTIDIIYGVSDSNGGTQQAVITITINPPNLAPIAATISTQTIQQCAASSPIDLLTGASDPNNDDITVLSASSPNGAIEILASGSVIFTPRCDFYGMAEINYMLVDSFGLQTQASFTIDVKQVVEVIAITESSGGVAGLWTLLGLSLMIFIKRFRMINIQRLFVFACLILSTSWLHAAVTENTDCELNNECKLEKYWPTGLYVGGNLGMSKTNIRQEDIDQAYAAGNIYAISIDVDETDWSYGANIGYQINQYFALQLEYIDFGERLVQFSGSTLADDLAVFYAAAETVYPETAQGSQISIVVSLPISNSAKVFAKAGYLDWEQKYKTTDPVLKGFDRTSGQDVPMGIGVRYLFREDIVFNLGIETVKLNRHRVNNVYAGIQYFPFADNQPSKKYRQQNKEVPATPKSEPEQAATIHSVPIDSDGDTAIDTLDSCVNTPSVDAVGANNCKRYETETKLMRLNLLFALNSSELTQGDLAEVAKLAKFMQEHSNTSVVLEGHTDIRGKAHYNQYLSERRANAVKQELIETHSIASSRVEAIGFGSSRLIDPANTETAHTMNRRTVAEISTETSIRANEYK